MTADDIIAWYGRVADNALATRPSFARAWLMAGYKGMAAKTQIAGDRRFLPSGREGYALFMSRVVSAMAHPERMAVTSIFTPNEIFHALGALPATAEAIASFASGAQAESGIIAAAEASGIPETYCSYHKTLMGLATTGVLEAPRMLAATSVACDANNLSFKTLAARWGVPFSFIDVPYELSCDAILYVADELRDMGKMAEEAFGKKLSETKLTGLCESSERTRKALLSTLPHRSGKNLRNTMTLEMMEMLDLHLLLGTPEAERFATHMKHDIAYADTYQGLNLVWGHVSPYFLEGIGRQIDCSDRAQIVASDMMLDFLEPEGKEANLMGARADGLLFGPETPYEFMAERVIRNCFNGPAERRGRTLVRLAQATHADGAVIFCHWGCRQTAGASQLMRQMLEDAGYPVLVLDGDAVDRANCMEGQMTTRFDAFLELLEAHRG